MHGAVPTVLLGLFPHLLQETLWNIFWVMNIIFADFILLEQPSTPMPRPKRFFDSKKFKPTNYALNGILEATIVPTKDSRYLGTMGLGWRPPDTALANTTCTPLKLALRVVAEY